VPRFRLWTREVNRAATAFRAVRFWNICRVPAVLRDFKSVKPRQRRVARGRSSNDESLQNEDAFRKLLCQITTLIFLVYPTAFTCVLAMSLGEDS